MDSSDSGSKINIQEIPILLTVFNRPDKAKAVIDNLRQIRPQRLYISADGPRGECPDDIEKCRLARQEATSVNWSCDIKTRFLEVNVGCDPAVSSAIDWFFQDVESGIILEDDCIVHPDYFKFCGELFVRYEHDERIMQISSLAPYEFREHPYDYHFSRTFRCSGGWATWRRAWKYYTSDMKKYGDEEALEILKSYYRDHSTWRQQYRRFLEFKAGSFVNWDFQWNMACFAQNGVCVVPEKNLMNNIGFDHDSTHTKKISPVFTDLYIQPLQFPLRHPPYVYADSRPERTLEKKLYSSIILKSRIMYILRRIIGIISYIREVMPYR